MFVYRSWTMFVIRRLQLSGLPAQKSFPWTRNVMKCMFSISPGGLPDSQGTILPGTCKTVPDTRVVCEHTVSYESLVGFMIL
jgi:hypothetical protein